MKLFIRNKTVRVVLRNLKEQHWLSEVLAVPIPGARYTKAFTNGWWDGRRRLFNKVRNTFAAGLLPEVLAWNRDRKRPFRVDLRDRRRDWLKPRTLTVDQWVAHLEGAGFKPDKAKCAYQVKGINKILRNEVEGVPWARGVVHLPTGSGKTIMAAGLLVTLDQPRTLVLCNRLDLLVQTREVLVQVLQRPVGQCGGGKHQLENVTVATVQTLGPKHLCTACGKKFPYKKSVCPACLGKKYTTSFAVEGLAKWLSGVKVLIIDECHKVGENEYANVINLVPAFVRLGLSATPLARGDVGDVLLVGATSIVVYKLRAASLARRGLLAVPVIQLVSITQPAVETEPIRSRNADVRRKLASARYRQVYNQGVVLHIQRNKAIADIVKTQTAKGHPVMVLVKLIAHGNVLVEYLMEAGLPNVAFLHGEDALDRRRELVRRFKVGEVPVVIASTIFDEAVDIPNIRSLILAGGGNSPIKAIQRVGRGMRKKEKGENRLYVFDFMDKTHDLLSNNSLERVRIYESQGYEVLVEES